MADTLEGYKYVAVKLDMGKPWDRATWLVYRQMRETMKHPIKDIILREAGTSVEMMRRACASPERGHVQEAPSLHALAMSCIDGQGILEDADDARDVELDPPALRPFHEQVADMDMEAGDVEPAERAGSGAPGPGGLPGPKDAATPRRAAPSQGGEAGKERDGGGGFVFDLGSVIG